MQGIKNYQTGTPGYRYEIVRLKTKLIQLGNRMWSRFAFAPTISVAQNPKKSIFGRLIPLCPDMRHWHRFLSDTGKKRDSDLAVWYLPNWASFSSIRRRPGVIHVKYMSATEPMRTSHASSAVYITVFFYSLFLTGVYNYHVYHADTKRPPACGSNSCQMTSTIYAPPCLNWHYMFFIAALSTSSTSFLHPSCAIRITRLTWSGVII